MGRGGTLNHWQVAKPAPILRGALRATASLKEAIRQLADGTDELEPYKRRGELDEQPQPVPNAIGIIVMSKPSKSERSLLEDYEHLIEHVAPLHSELLFIHPFREGNGRTARLFADLIALKSGFDRFNFEKITEKRMPEYIAAVQAAADKNYEPMTRLFGSFKK